MRRLFAGLAEVENYGAMQVWCPTLWFRLMSHGTKWYHGIK